MRIIRATASIIVTTCLLMGGTANATDQDPPIRTEYMPCATEDSTNCVWDAVSRGNHTGQSSFTGKDGKVWPLPHHMARFLVYGNNARGTYFPCATPVSSDPVDCIWEETVWLGREGNDTVIPHHVARYLLAH